MVGVSGSSFGIQSKFKQFELFQTGFSFFPIGSLNSDVISRCFLGCGFSDNIYIFA